MPKAKANPSQAAPAAPGPRRRLSVWKKLLLAATVTAAVLLLIELLLAAVGVRPLALTDDPYVGFTGYSPLFVEQTPSGGTPVMARSPAKAKYFNNQQFPRTKAADVRRVFCLGGSTTFGRPYDDATSFCGWLRHFLPVADPSYKWEVVNAGGISYASYRLATLTEELVTYDPDVLVIYTGHNEFLERRTYDDLMNRPQWVRSLYGFLTGTRMYSAAARALRPGDTSPQSAEGLMPSEVQTLLDRSVGPADYSRRALKRREAMEHFRHNLNRMIDLADEAGAAVVLIVPAANLADCSPFKSQHRDGLTGEQQGAFKVHLAEATKALEASAFNQALSAADAAAAIDNRYAEAHYLRGRALVGLGRTDDAKGAFQRAVAEDICPLRAGADIQKIVRQVARTRKTGLVDFARLAAEGAPGGIAGDKQFLDHVHPTIAGHRDIALAVVKDMAARKMIRRSGKLDSAAIERIDRTVTGSLDPADHARALRAAAQVFGWAGKFDQSARLLRRADAMDPGGATPDSVTNLGIVLHKAGEHRQAVEQFHLALKKDARFAPAHSALASSLMVLGELPAAEASIRRAVAIDPKNPTFHHGLGTILLRRGKTDQAEVSFRRAVAADATYTPSHIRLGQILLAADKPTKAEKHFRAALAGSDRSIQARVGLGLCLAAQGKGREALKEIQTASAIDTDDLYAMANLAWLLATCPQDDVRNGRRAVELATRACELTAHQSPELLDVLAAAYAEAGRFPQAVKTATQAAALAQQQNKPAAAKAIRQRLNTYKTGQPYRERP